MNNRFRITMIVSIIMILVLSLVALCMGQYTISIQDVISVLLHKDVSLKNAYTVIYNVRIPRIILSLCAGAGLAVAGASFQALFSNPLATPDTLGCANGASFGAALGILLGFQSIGTQLSALVFGLSAILLVFLVTQTKGYENRSMMMVILAGMVISSLFSALVSLVKYVADPNDVLPVITFWLMGSFSSATIKSLMIGVPCILIGMIVLYLLRYRLNALSLSEDEAKSLGINLKKTRIIVILASSLITTSIVSLCGVIGWVGLLIPHISRMCFGNDNRRIIPSCITFGALFMLIVDTFARCATTSEIPVSILTAIIGAPVFIILLRKSGGIRV